MSDEESDGDHADTSSNDYSSSIEDCELIEDDSSDEKIEESPSQSAIPSSQSDTSSQQDPTSASQESGSGAMKM